MAVVLGSGYSVVFADEQETRPLVRMSGGVKDLNTLATGTVAVKVRMAIP